MAAATLHAATPPAITVASSGHGQIKGGVAFGNSGRIYFSGLASGDEGYVKALNSSHQVLWTWAQVTDELPSYNVPALSADGSRLYLGADDGVFYCLDAVTGAKLWQYAVPTGADRCIRSSAAVGWAHNSAGRRRAFYVPIESTTLQELPRLAGTAGSTYQSEAYGVTQLGEVVGTIQNDANAWRAFYYTPGASAVVDLGLTPLATDGTPASQGWTLTVANAVSESGYMVGQGIRHGVPKAWILYPQCQA